MDVIINMLKLSQDQYCFSALSTRSEQGPRDHLNNPDMNLGNRNSPILHQVPIHQQSPQMTGAASSVMDMRGKPGLYSATSSAISRPAWKWWR